MQLTLKGVNMIKMPKLAWGKCSDCNHLCQYFFNDYGCTNVCVVCDAAPSSINKTKERPAWVTA